MKTEICIAWFTAFILTFNLGSPTFGEEKASKTERHLEPSACYLDLITYRPSPAHETNYPLSAIRRRLLNIKFENQKLRLHPDLYLIRKNKNGLYSESNPQNAAYERLYCNGMEWMNINSPLQDDYVIGLRFSFKKFSLKKCYRAILINKELNASIAENLPTVSLFFQLPDF